MCATCYGKDVDFDDDGATGLLGLRVGLGEKFALQVDGTIDYVPSPSEVAADNYTNWGVQGGPVLLFGNSYDNDKDGVKDNDDRCPGTPAGESVDTNGCAASQRDTDKDSVKDSADRCPIPRRRQDRRRRLLPKSRRTRTTTGSSITSTSASTLRPVRR